jgi:hypothetical protein
VRLISYAALLAEKHDNAGTGKYQIGLGQDRMAFVGDREDINSICLTGTFWATLDDLLPGANAPAFRGQLCAHVIRG